MEIRPRYFAALVVVLLSCGSQREFSDYPHDAFVVRGTMRFINIETGCWVLTSEDGERYEPTGNGVSGLMEEGRTVTLVVRRLTGVASTCQTGVIIEVLRILNTESE